MSHNFRDLSFNQKGHMLTCVVAHGIMVVELDTLKPRLIVAFPDTVQVKCAEHYGTTQVIYFVSEQCKNVLQMWDDEKRNISRRVEMPFDILAVKSHYSNSHSGYVQVIMETEVRIFNPSLKNCLRVISTNPNPHAICLFSEPRNSVLLPGANIGELRWLIPVTSSSPKADTESEKCHENELQCISLNKDSSLLATASERGTLIRLYSIEDDRKLALRKEFRRGSSLVSISHITFSQDSQLLSVVSDKNTLHIFYLGPHNRNIYSSLWVLGSMSSYFSSEWSMLQIYIPDCENITFKCIFINDPSTSKNEYALYVVGSNGILYDYLITLPVDDMNNPPSFTERRRVKITF